MEEIPQPEPKPPLRVGITYNLKKDVKSDVLDQEAEYDSIETVLAIKDVLEGVDCKVELVEADEHLLSKLADSKFDIVYNIAEGHGDRGREAQVPAILSFLGIPFTGSDETTLGIALDKALAKRLVASYHIRTPNYQVFSAPDQKLKRNFRFPAIVKPNAEGSGKGISDISIVFDAAQLYKLLEANMSMYKQEMLVEEYISGREFTVGVVGNGNDVQVFTPMEIVYLNKENPYNIYSYSVKQNFKKHVKYECPASINREINQEMMNTSRRIYEALACKDCARIDFRLSDDNKLYFIEINPLPGLAPGYSDFPILAEFCSVDYASLVRRIFASALKRHGLDS